MIEQHMLFIQADIDVQNIDDIMVLPYEPRIFINTYTGERMNILEGLSPARFRREQFFYLTH